MSSILMWYQSLMVENPSCTYSQLKNPRLEFCFPPTHRTSKISTCDEDRRFEARRKGLHGNNLKVLFHSSCWNLQLSLCTNQPYLCAPIAHATNRKTFLQINRQSNFVPLVVHISPKTRRYWFVKHPRKSGNIWVPTLQCLIDHLMWRILLCVKSLRNILEAVVVLHCCTHPLASLCTSPLPWKCASLEPSERRSLGDYPHLSNPKVVLVLAISHRWAVNLCNGNRPPVDWISKNPCGTNSSVLNSNRWESRRWT